MHTHNLSWALLCACVLGLADMQRRIQYVTDLSKGLLPKVQCEIVSKSYDCGPVLAGSELLLVNQLKDE